MDKISDFFSNFFSTIQTKWQGFTTIQKGGVAGGFVVFLGSLMTFFVYQNNTTSVYLFKNMSDEDTVAISSFLKKFWCSEINFWAFLLYLFCFLHLLALGAFFCVFGILAGWGGIRVSDPLQKNKKNLVRG
mgnify:CR=1 FL=1